MPSVRCLICPNSNINACRHESSARSSVCVCVCASALEFTHLSHANTHTTRAYRAALTDKPTNRQTNHRMDSAAAASADRGSLLQHMAELRHSKATGCLLLPSYEPACACVQRTVGHCDLAKSICYVLILLLLLLPLAN